MRLKNLLSLALMLVLRDVKTGNVMVSRGTAGTKVTGELPTVPSVLSVPSSVKILDFAKRFYRVRVATVL